MKLRLHLSNCGTAKISVIGHCMTPEELSTLQDLYAELDDTSLSKTTYVLQTLWRDHSTDHDIVGPYYTSAGCMAVFEYSLLG